MRKTTALLLFLWTLLVLYPNPVRLVASLQHAWSPPIDRAAVRELATRLPDDPLQIEQIVNSTLVPYAAPWRTYGVPWYFPTPREVLAHGEGDCQARAVVFASILHAKGIPATIVGSPNHLWVDYPGKAATALENRTVALAVLQPEGRYRFRWPELIDWSTSWAIVRENYWEAMPPWRFRLLLTGWIVIGLRHRLVRLARQTRDGLQPSGEEVPLFRLSRRVASRSD